MAIRKIHIYDGVDTKSDVLGASTWLPEVIQELGGRHNDFFVRLGHTAKIIERAMPRQFATPEPDRIPFDSTSANHHLEIFPSMNAETTGLLASFILSHNLAVLNTRPVADIAMVTDLRQGGRIPILSWSAAEPITQSAIIRHQLAYQ
jgi:hypothetical protein